MQSSPVGPRAVRGERMRELRRAASSQNQNRAVDHIRPAAELDRDAKASSERLKASLKAGPPWIKDVEVHRQQCRDLLLTLLFGHPLSTHAQSLEPLWHHTTYSLISAYRSLVSNLESQLPPTNGGRKKQGAAHAELKKVLTRFRLVLASEDTFYRSLISRLVGFYQLQPLTREYLSAISIGVPEEVPNGGPEEGLAPRMSHEERKEKLGLVYKALICLGDLERYKEQYDDKTRREARESKSIPVTKHQERFNKAWTYYEVARSLVPDDGSAFNQLAVISTYLGDEFLCVYYYIRALAVKNAFKNIHEILDKFLRKVYEKWVGRMQRRRRDSTQEEDDEVDRPAVEKDVLLLAAILFRRSGLSSIPKLEADFMTLLQGQLAARKLSSEIVAKMSATFMGVHWQARQAASVAPANEDPRATSRRHEAEIISLRIFLGVYGKILSVSTGEVEEALRARAGGSAISLDDREPQLHVHISAVLRRLLPSLRILSKWLKLHLEYISRVQRSGQLGSQIAQFWDNYTRLVIALATLFPIDQLPSLTQPLEEDIDMKGFIPLAWGMHRTHAEEEQHDFHPNEEQLMRISDLQVDAKLLAQTSTGAVALSPQQPSRHLPTMGFRAEIRDRQDDMASVSTETEDDPVNMAMRATLGGSSTDGESVKDDGEEIIVWNGRSSGNTTQPAAHTSYPSPQPTTSPYPNHNTPTAQDLLQNLVINPSGSSSPAYAYNRPLPQTSIPRHSPSMHQPASGQRSPGMLFGGDVTGSSIWTMTREESGRGHSRNTSNNANIASIWGAREPSPPPVQGVPATGGWQTSGQSGAFGAHPGMGNGAGQMGNGMGIIGNGAGEARGQRPGVAGMGTHGNAVWEGHGHGHGGQTWNAAQQFPRG